MRSKKELEVIQSVFHKAWQNPAFKEQLLNQPVEAIKEATGMGIGTTDNRELVVLDQTDTSYLFLNIPPKPDVDSVELTEEQLEMVAGGTDIGRFVNHDPIIVCWPPINPPPYNPFETK